ncbi:MAG: ribonuclease HIII, partial [Solobacterium sp.]|nr:ribonuclease HIII [Solobacterium sp.]
MSTITLKPSKKDCSKLYETFKETAVKTPPQYAEWQLRPEGCVITCYTSGKVVFQGKDAEVYASPFQANPSVTLPQGGSDEVGTGDYFGPVCVAAAVVRSDTIETLTSLGVRDSKALDDEQIRKIAPKLKEILPHSLLIVSPSKYNEVHKTNNMNAIKAKLHNQAYLNLMEKTDLPDFCVVDQFAEPPVYYHYLRFEKKVVRTLHFETKAENKYPAVGAASVLARNAFLEFMDEMSAYYRIEFTKGSGSNTDRCAERFVKKYGYEKLGEVAKLHFKNT